MKTIIALCFLFACVYSAEYAGTYKLDDTVDTATCCLPSAFTLKGTSPTYVTGAVYPSSGAQCNTDGLTSDEVIGAAAGATSPLTGTIGARVATFTFDSDGDVTLAIGACSADYEKSAYLFGIGALVVLSFTYLFA